MFFQKPNVEQLYEQKQVKGLIKALRYWPWRGEFRLQGEEVRASAAKYLGSLREKRAVEPLIQAVNDVGYEVRENAIDALGEIGDTRCIPCLLDALEGDLYFRSAAVEALDKLNWSPSDDTQKALRYLAEGHLQKCADMGAPAVKTLVTTLDRITAQEIKGCRMSPHEKRMCVKTD